MAAHALEASPTMALTVSAAMTLTTLNVAAVGAAVVTPAVNLTVGSQQELAVAASVALTVAADLEVRPELLASASWAVVTGQAALSKQAPLAAVGGMVWEGSGRLGISGQGLTVAMIVDEVAVLWGRGCCLELDECLRESIMHALNTAMQTIYSRSRVLGYFNRQEITATVTGGDSEIALADNVMAVEGPARLSSDNTPLRLLAGLVDKEQFANHYVGDAPSEVRAYYIEARRRARGDSVQHYLHVAPTPADDTPVKMQAMLEPPRYEWPDYANGTPVALPHLFVESLLLPLVRWWATNHRYYTRRENFESIRAQFESAQQQLGLVDASVVRAGRDKQPEGERSAA